MDPITAAVVAALAAGLGSVAKKAVEDGYQGLKRLLAQRTGSDSGLVRSVEALEGRPDSQARQQVLAEEVADRPDLAKDEEVLRAARAIMAAVEEAGGAAPVTAVDSGITAAGNVNVTSGRDAAGRDIRRR